MSTQNTIKTEYTSDTRCARCDGKFGLGFPKYTKKHCCKFCGHGVCSSCSPQRVPNPETSRIDRICNYCYQRVMTDHFKKTMNQEIEDLKRQKSELYFALGQEIRNRAKICTKKRILESLLRELEIEAEVKDREQRTELSKLKAEKDDKLIRMDGVIRMYNQSQRDIEKKEVKLRDSELEGLNLSSRLISTSPELASLWSTMKSLSSKKVKLSQKFLVLSAGCQNSENENYSDLLRIYNEYDVENQRLVLELSQLTAELEIKEKKIKSLEKKLLEARVNSLPEDDPDPIISLKQKLEDQRKTIETLKLHLQEDPISAKPCTCSII